MKNNAFEILGAEPTDNEERLRELLDEKQLLLDDSTEVQNAYADLSNPRKRIAYEVIYFSYDALSPFFNLINDVKKDSLDVNNIAKIFVELGCWFEADDEELFEKINENRVISNFPLLNNISDVLKSVELLKKDCISQSIAFLDDLDEKTLVKLFNKIVDIEEYESFFIDELITQYELRIKETIEQKESICKNSFDEIETICSNFNKKGFLDGYLSYKVEHFCKALKEWDKYAQPLQVNIQKRGGQHDNSLKFVNSIRNRIIDLSNESQEYIKTLLFMLEMKKPASAYDYSAQEDFLRIREKLENRVIDSITFIDNIIYLMNTLYSVFKELDIIADQLKKDKATLNKLKMSLEDFEFQIKKVKNKERLANVGNTVSNFTSGCYIATCVYGSYDCPEVWTLRRYRDNNLGVTWYGRLFIRIYYAISPTIVKWFGNTKWFKSMWRKFLDKKVKKLQKQGFESTPYEDIDWRKKQY